VRYEVYTLRRTSTRTVYAIYDNLRSEPVCKNGSQQPITTTDRDVARKWVLDLERS
jgi:hypothetical protein